VLRQVPSEWRSEPFGVRPLDDERWDADCREHAPNVALVDQADYGLHDPGARRLPLVACPSATNVLVMNEARCEQVDHQPVAGACLDLRDGLFDALGRPADRVVVRLEEAGETIHEHEADDPLGVRRRKGRGKQSAANVRDKHGLL
jgi:hypothetical protein